MKTIDPDAERMVRFQQGDRAAFEVLFEKYHPPLLRFAYRFLINQADAEEVVQETFLQVYQAAPNYQPLARFSTWLYTIAKNRCLNRLRAGGDESFGEDLFPEGIEIIPSGDPPPDRELERREISHLVQRAIGELPPSLRLPLILRRYEELSYEEIAEIAGCTVTAVKLRLHRAKLLLAKELAPYFREK